MRHRGTMPPFSKFSLICLDAAVVGLEEQVVRETPRREISTSAYACWRFRLCIFIDPETTPLAATYENMPPPSFVAIMRASIDRDWLRSSEYCLEL